MSTQAGSREQRWGLLSDVCCLLLATMTRRCGFVQHDLESSPWSRGDVEHSTSFPPHSVLFFFFFLILLLILQRVGGRWIERKKNG